MKLHYPFLTAALLLAACGGATENDLGGGGGGGGGGGDVIGDDGVEPEDLPVAGDEVCGDFTCSGEITNVVYNDVDDELYLTGLPFDDNPLGAVYTLLGTTNGFNVYQNTDPGTFNQYLALHNDSAGGEITVGVAAVEGYQEHGYTGAWYQLNDLTTTIPGSGLVAYSGTYAGLMTYIGSGDLDQTIGTLAMEVDFTDSKLKGFITGRTIVGGAALPTLILNDTDIDDGSFAGTVNSYDGQEVLETGTYQGFFGGADAGVIGGLVQAFNPDFAGDDTEGDETDDLSTRDLGTFIGTD